MINPENILSMFNFDIHIFSWVLLGVQIIIAATVLIFVLKPLRVIRRLPINYSGTSDLQPSATAATLDTEEEPVDEESDRVNEESVIEGEEASVETGEENISTEEEASVETEEESLSEEGAQEKRQPSYVPKVSVVVYSTVNEDTLTDFLRSVCRQDYPDFEVIVVCDASFETSGILSEKYEELFKKVYVTFIPPGSHNLSRRKLALTLGIKAAKGEIVLCTVANALIPSDKWIMEMAQPFFDNPSLELSLGYSHPDYQEISGPGKYYKQFFQTLTDARWIGYALMGKPYRGDGFNMAILRSTFFRVKGFSKTMHLHSGEDDLFVNDIADAYNTAVVVSPDSILTTRSWEAAKRIFNLRRSQYDFTARWLPLGPFVRAGLASLSQWLVLLAGLGGALWSLPNLIPAIAVFIIWIAFLVVETSIYRKAAEKLEASALSWQVALFWLIKPINNLYFRASHRSSRFKNFTWQRHKTVK